jgi:hypothetical protein
MQLLSEMSGVTAAEIDAVLTRLDQQDSHVDDVTTALGGIENTDDLVQAYSPLRSVIESQASVTPQKRKREHWKVEVPLTPSFPSSTPTKKAKTVAFKEMLHEVIPSLVFPSSLSPKDMQVSSDMDYEAFFNSVIAPIAMQAENVLENERLQAIDAEGRVPVSEVPLYRPVAPWAPAKSLPHTGRGLVKSKAMQKAFNAMIAEHVDLESKWRGITKVEYSLGWSPLPKELEKVPVDEMIEDARYMANILADMSLDDVVTSDSLTWKSDGLRLLDDLDDSEDELEPGPIQAEKHEQSVDFLVRKRKLEMDDVNEHVPSDNGIAVQPSATLRTPLPRHTNKKAPAPSVSTRPTEIPQRKQSAPDNDLIYSGMFTARSALSQFLHTRGEESRPIHNDTSARTKGKATLSRSEANPKQHDQQASPEETVQKARPLIPLPEIPASLPARPIIVSLSLLTTSRHLLRELRRLYPALKTIERNFSPGSNKIATDEPDIIVSPPTGLILTTLQKLKQKPLPGQPAKQPTLQDRLITTSTRYERLLVLVAEGLNQERDLDKRDCDALADLAGFTNTLDTEMQIIYVPGGTDEALASWIITCICTYGVSANSATILLDEETTWEHFLRRAGLNAFAAQMIIRELQNTGGAVPPNLSFSASASASTHDARSEEGLRAFVRMFAQERTERFEGLMGGRRVLERVNAVMEKRWVSAADGFAGVRRRDEPVDPETEWAQDEEMEWREDEDMLLGG